MKSRVTRLVPAAAIAWLLLSAAFAEEPWIITEPTLITEPMRVNDVIVVSGGDLVVRGVPEPGLEVEGNLWAIGDGSITLEGSVVQFFSSYHGQYSLAAAEHAVVEVSGCDYRVPNGVQHALIAVGDARLTVTETGFGNVQLLAAERALLRADRLDGHFEVLVQNDARMELADIPRSPGGGNLWVWVEFPPGSEAVYTPPMPGFVESWSFPPADAIGIEQSVSLDRCEALLWPMLVREDCRLTLRDIPEDNWVVVGFHLPDSIIIRDLVNGTWATDEQVDLSDRFVRLENASIDTWNLYPEERARVEVWDSWLGEILAMEDSVVVLEDTVIDGTGGFFGARDRSLIVARGCTFTCTVEAAQESTLRLHRCSAEPYSLDPTGAHTRFGAYDQAQLLADHTSVTTTPALGGQGVIAATWIANPPLVPPVSGSPVTLSGSAALYSLDPGLRLSRWRTEAVPRWGRRPRLLGLGEENVEDGEIGVWEGADPRHDYRLRMILTDSWGRTLIGGTWVQGTGFPPVSGRQTAAALPLASRRTAGPARMRPVPLGPATAGVRDRQRAGAQGPAVRVPAASGGGG